MRPDRGFVIVSFPVSQFEANGWHDRVRRYDGQAVTLFSDGQLRAVKGHQGRILINNEPLIIGAEMDGEKMVHEFRGELAEAAICSRTLTDAEISALSRQP